MNYTTYYTRGQKVFLINTTPDRDPTYFEAFSATIIACENQQFELRTRYPLHHGDEGHLKPGMQFKVTAESFGSGVQFNGVVDSVSGAVFVLRPLSPIEMYQRSQVIRMDLTLGFRAFTRTAPLAIFRSEQHRFSSMLSDSTVEKLELEPIQINLGAGGLRYVVEQSDQQTDLAMVFIEIEQGAPPVCAVAELLWRRTLPDDEGTAIGRRFVIISKADQERIENSIKQRQKKLGKKLKLRKHNWELLDRMFHESH